MKKIMLLLVLLVAFDHVFARDQIEIVGSTKVYPFAHFVAEEFGSISRYPTPIVEATGTDEGFKLFCNDNGLNSPDMTSANRRMTPKEFRLCDRNGVVNITEVMFGYESALNNRLFFYIKNDHVASVPALREYIELFFEDELIGKEGELIEMGLIPMSKQLIEESVGKAKNLQKLTLEALK